MPQHYRIGHLSQHLEFSQDSVLAEACSALPESEDGTDLSYRAEAALHGLGFEGEVLVDGKPIEIDSPADAMLLGIGMVHQEFMLIPGFTIFENIKYAKDDATREGIVEAARAVGAHEFIMKLPDGYETELEQRGGNLSLGQRQLISFARAIVADAKIRILDEATASIDSYTEMLIQQALHRLLEGRTGMVIAHRLGAGGATDAWVQAFRIPNALRRLTAEGSMTIAFVPTYVRVREQQGPEAAREFAQRVLGIVLAATVVLSAGGMAFSDQLTPVFSPGFIDQQEKFFLTSSLIAWTFPYLVFISLVAWAMGVLNSEGRFAAPAAAPVFLNLGIIVAVLGFSGFFPQPVLAIAGGVLVGGILQMVLQVPSLVAVRLRLLPRWGWTDENVRGLMRLLIPSLFGVAVYEINIIVLGIIASFLPTGQIFHYHNALRMTELVLGLFAFSFTMAGLPRLSEHRSHACSLDFAPARRTAAASKNMAETEIASRKATDRPTKCISATSSPASVDFPRISIGSLWNRLESRVKFNTWLSLRIILAIFARSR